MAALSKRCGQVWIRTQRFRPILYNDTVHLRAPIRYRYFAY